MDPLEMIERCEQHPGHEHESKKRQTFQSVQREERLREYDRVPSQSDQQKAKPEKPRSPKATTIPNVIPNVLHMAAERQVHTEEERERKKSSSIGTSMHSVK